jgi:hypothetical protein
MATRFKVVGVPANDKQDVFEWQGTAKDADAAKAKAKVPDTYKDVRVYKQQKDWHRINAK